MRLTSIVHILSPETDNSPSWISRRMRTTVENISWSVFTKECCRPRRGLNPRPPAAAVEIGNLTFSNHSNIILGSTPARSSVQLMTRWHHCKEPFIATPLSSWYDLTPGSTNHTYSSRPLWLSWIPVRLVISRLGVSPARSATLFLGDLIKKYFLL